MKFSKIQKIETDKKRCYDLTVENNHNFFCDGSLIHNCDYRGEIKVILYNSSDQDFIVKKGDRIAQLVFFQIIQAIFQRVDEVASTDRGEGGLGSTGV
jgi:deoxyuridine 5'-triphosphate nucleotidohydrolase